MVRFVFRGRLKELVTGQPEVDLFPDVGRQISEPATKNDRLRDPDARQPPGSGTSGLLGRVATLRQLFEHQSDDDNDDVLGGDAVADGQRHRPAEALVDHHGEPEQHHFDSRRLETQLIAALPEGGQDFRGRERDSSLPPADDVHEEDSLEHLHQVRHLHREQRIRLPVLSSRQRGFHVESLSSEVHHRGGRFQQLRARGVRKAQGRGPAELAAADDRKPSAAQAAGQDGAPGFKPKQRHVEGGLRGRHEARGLESRTGGSSGLAANLLKKKNDQLENGVITFSQ